MKTPLSRRAFLSGRPPPAVAASSAAPFALPGAGMMPKSCSAMIDLQRYTAQETYALQLRSEWCWAACVSMICKFHGFNLSQPRIVQQMHGSLINKPGDDKLLTEALNRVWDDDDGKPIRTSAVVFSPILDKFDVDNRRVLDDLKNDSRSFVGRASTPPWWRAPTTTTAPTAGRWCSRST